jgi:D-alanyl-D-alanine carboxypeptidase
MKNIIGFVIGIFFLSIFPAFIYSQPGADSLLNFIQQNKSKTSLFLKKNDTIIAKLNENKLMPLASTVKIMVAIEFAKQAAHDIFNANKKIPLSELDKYYLPNTDGDAHPRWINYERELGNITNDSVKLIDVAKGMIVFSSNANTEYLMDILGFDNVKNNIRLLGLKQHTAIYPLVSSLFLYQNPKKVSEDKILKEIRKMDDEDYSRAAFFIHNELKNDSNYKKKFRPQDLTLKMQKEWSNKLPASTTKEYVQVCSILNNRKYFDENTYDILAAVLETLMEKPTNKSWLSHAGMKGGSTIFVLTKALYATLQNGTKIEMAYFFNDLAGDENQRLQRWMDDFEIQVLTDENFRKKIVF